jgi:hypothetical protein
MEGSSSRELSEESALALQFGLRLSRLPGFFVAGGCLLGYVRKCRCRGN